MAFGIDCLPPALRRRSCWNLRPPHRVCNLDRLSVEDAELPGSVNGDCTHELHRIRVEISNSPAQRVKTLAHEIGHALLHEQFDNRALAELEAESTAYVICQALVNLDTSDYSFGYVAGWAGGGEQAIAGIKGSCERIQKAAASVLQSFEVEQEEAA
jgi:hypothetical protein